MADLIQNTNPKRNPITTIFGAILLTISAVLFVVPYFLTLKEPVAWWAPIIPLGLGPLKLNQKRNENQYSNFSISNYFLPLIHG